MMWVFEEFYLQNAVLQSLNATFLVLIPKKEGANDIRKGWEEFILRTSIRIGNGRHMGFWWDNWVGDSKLKDVFPSLFRIAAHKYATVADLWRGKGMEAVVGMCISEDLSKTRNWRR